MGPVLTVTVSDSLDDGRGNELRSATDRHIDAAVDDVVCEADNGSVCA